MAKYSVFDSRPKEIFRYSYEEPEDVLRFDYSQLHGYSLIKELVPGSKYDYKRRTSLIQGCKKYKRKIFTEQDSKVRNFLITLAAYKFIEKPKAEDPPIEILCHNGVHNDLILNSGDVYNIIFYKGKLIFANTATRANQNKILSYIGPRFETILCQQPKPRDSSHCKILIEGKYGKWPFKSVVEIDSYKNHKCKTYCEMKLSYIEGINEEEKLRELNSISSDDANDWDNAKINLLKFLKDNVKAFYFKFKKWIFQSYFGLQDILVVGIRDDKFYLVSNFEFNLQKHIIPFMRDTYPSLYETFVNAIDILDSKYESIYKQVTKLQESETDVFEIKCNKELSVKKLESSTKFQEIMVSEYLTMVNKGVDDLRRSKHVDYDSYHVQLVENTIKNIKL